MKLAIGADHAGFVLKDRLRDELRQAGHEVTDMGTNSAESTDYPDYAAKVARSVASGESERGILVCGSGIGMAIAANKIHGIRAAVGEQPGELEFARRHNNINVLTLGARFTQPETADQLIDVFLKTPFDGGRHERRVEKISKLEETQ
jgi:RpiB/LacA/LacB family sugar-phosphate isomerase